MSRSERDKDRAQDLATELLGKGAAVSEDTFGDGWRFTAWEPDGRTGIVLDLRGSVRGSALTLSAARRMFIAHLRAMLAVVVVLLLTACGSLEAPDSPIPAPSSAPSSSTPPLVAPVDASPPVTADASDDGAELDAGTLAAARDAELDGPACASSDERVDACYAHAAPPQWATPRPCIGDVTRERDGAVELRGAGLLGCWRVNDEDSGSIWCCPD